MKQCLDVVIYKITNDELQLHFEDFPCEQLKNFNQLTINQVKIFQFSKDTSLKLYSDNFGFNGWYWFGYNYHFVSTKKGGSGAAQCTLTNEGLKITGVHRACVSYIFKKTILNMGARGDAILSQFKSDKQCCLHQFVDGASAANCCCGALSPPPSGLSLVVMGIIVAIKCVISLCFPITLCMPFSHWFVHTFFGLSI